MMRFSLICFSLFLFLSPALLAQRYVDVDPDVAGAIGALNRAIDGDTTATGERVDPLNTIYRLQRGATYRLNLAVRNAGFPLTIEAAEGDGERPIIVPGVTLEGISDVPFRPLDDMTLRGVFITGRDSNDGLIDQIIRIQAEGVRIIVDDCIIDESSQAAMRADTEDVKIYLTNSIVSRMGTPDDIDNGRVFDDRGNNVDTLVFENNTIYNITSRIIRNGGTNSIIRYCKFNQNTMVNVGQRLSDFGPVITFEFTNNIAINGAFLGVEADRDPFNPDEPDPNQDPPVAAIVLEQVAQSILDEEGATQSAIISNNNIYMTKAVADALPFSNPDPDDDDLVIPRPVFSATAQGFIEEAGSANTNISDTLSFSNAVPDPLLFIQEFWDNFAGTTILAPWNNEGAPYDFSYPGASVSATASTSNEQLGDLNWPLISFSKEALEELIAEAEGLLESSTVGGNIGNFAQFAVDSLIRAIDASNLVLNDPGATPSEVEEAITALNNAIDYFFTGLVTSVDIRSIQTNLLYPNPTTSDFSIETNQTLRSVSIYSSSGKIIHSWQSPGKDAVFQLSDLKNGTYIVKIESDGNETEYLRLLKAAVR